MLELSHAAALVVLIVLMGSVAGIDMKLMIIPDALNAAIFVTGMMASFCLGIVDSISALSASILGGGFLVIVQATFRIYRGYDGLGWGDVKFVAAAATWTGIEGVAMALLIASTSALTYVLGRQILDVGFEMRRRVPFGPFLALGATSVAMLQILSGRSMMDVVDLWFPVIS
jgi:leader peptidase (prepilin peptidase) / N-methyltransferase